MFDRVRCSRSAAARRSPLTTGLMRRLRASLFRRDVSTCVLLQCLYNAQNVAYTAACANSARRAAGS